MNYKNRDIEISIFDDKYKKDMAIFVESVTMGKAPQRRNKSCTVFWRRGKIILFLTANDFLMPWRGIMM